MRRCWRARCWWGWWAAPGGPSRSPQTKATRREACLVTLVCFFCFVLFFMLLLFSPLVSVVVVAVVLGVGWWLWSGYRGRVACCAEPSCTPTTVPSSSLLSFRPPSLFIEATFVDTGDAAPCVVMLGGRNSDREPSDSVWIYSLLSYGSVLLARGRKREVAWSGEDWEAVVGVGVLVSCLSIILCPCSILFHLMIIFFC